MNAGLQDAATAVIAAVPATIAALAAWRSARATRHQTTPSNGARLAETIEETREDVRELKSDLQYHVTVQHGRGPLSDNR